MTRYAAAAIRSLSLALLALLTLAAAAPAQLGSAGTQFWNEGSPGTGANLQAGAETGRALAIGDFDCNGFADLAIGMPGDEAGGDAEAGRVLVLYGSESGPVTDGHSLLSQDTPGIQDATEPFDRFGQALAAGNFDGDDCDDLAIGAPGEGVGDPVEVVEAGAVHVLYGSVLGLTVAGDELFTQASSGVAGVAQTEDRFGQVLLSADLDQDGFDELVVGVPEEDIEGAPTVEDAGAVHIFLGSSSGLDSEASLLFVAGDSVLNYVPHDFERLGAALAAGEFVFDDDLHLELAVGRPGRAGNDPGENGAGGVEVIGNIFAAAYSFSVRQGQSGVPGEPEAFDHFGEALAAADFTGDGYADLVVGAPDEDLEGVPAEAAGAVFVIDIAFAGDDEVWTQEQLSPAAAEPFDRLGAAVATGDFNGDGVPDLAIGAPGESLAALADAGVVHILFAAEGSGLSASGRQLLLQTIDPSDDGDEFGATLATGHISGHTGADLAVGAPGEDLGAATDAGGVNTFFSTVLFVDGFETGLPPWSGHLP